MNSLRISVVDERVLRRIEENADSSDAGVTAATQLTEDLGYEARLEKCQRLRICNAWIIENLYLREGYVYKEQISKMV